MAIALPSADLVARFRRDLSAVGGSPDRLGLAVSGGPDSLALLLLASAAWPGRVAAVTVDHRLRAESMLEALNVEFVCDQLGCPHAILGLDTPPGPANLQADARHARYAALAAWAGRNGIAAVATAHHADDQAETVLMRLQRGSGVAGLAGIRPAQRIGSLQVIRPLLGWTKAELVHIVAGAGIEPADDPSNRNPRFDRAGVRALLRAQPALAPDRLSRSAAACRDADDALDWMVERLVTERLIQDDAGVSLDAQGLPRELTRRLVMLALARAAGELNAPPRSIDRLLSALEAGEVGMMAGVRAAGGALWRFTLARPRRAVPP